MKVAIIYNKDFSEVINRFGLQNKEKYNPETVNMVANALEKGGHNVRIIEGDMFVIEQLREFMPQVVEGERMGMVFNMAYGIQGESRYTHLPAMLEMIGIPYVGSGPEGHAIALDKVITKIVLQKYGLPTPMFWVFSNSDEDMSMVQFPVIVKPKMEAVSYGIRVVSNENELREAVDFIISEFEQQALVEQFIRGREFCVGLLGNGDPETFPVLEIDLEGNPDAIQSDLDKLENPRNKICPADLPSELSEEMVRLSKEVFRVLGLRDFARVDVRLDESGRINILEVNSMASLGQTGSYVNAAMVAGYDYDGLINKMLEVATVRYFSQKSLLFEDDTVIEKKDVSLAVRVRMFLKSKQDEMEKLLKNLVNTNTYVRNVDGINTISQYISKQLSQLGFTYQNYPQIEIGNVVLLSNTTSNQFDVLLLAHLDNSTQFKNQKSYRQSENKALGTDIWGSKGGLVVMVSALRALRFVRLLKRMKVGVLLTTDNTLQGRLTQQVIEDVSKRAKAIIGLSGASSVGSLVTSRSGSVVYECQMNLVNPENAFDVTNANIIFSNLISQFTKLSNEKDGFIVSPREVVINSSLSPPSAQAVASLSVRFNSKDQAEIIENRIRQLVKNAIRDKIKIIISGKISRNPMIRTDMVEDFFINIKKIAKQLDLRISDEHRWSSSNIGYVNDGIPIIDGMGLIGGQVREYEEYVLRYSLLERSTLMALLLTSFIKKS